MDVAKERRPPVRTRLKQALRAIVFVAFIVLGSLATRGKPANGLYYQGTGEIVGALVAGAVVAVFYLFVVGAIAVGIAKVRGRSRTLRGATFGLPVMLITLVLLLVSAGGRYQWLQEAVSKAVPNTNGTALQKERANQDAYEWAQKWAIPTRYTRTFPAAYNSLLKSLKAQGNTAATRRLVAQERAMLAHARAAALAIPDVAEADLDTARDQAVRWMTVLVRAYSDYGAGLALNARDGLALSQDKKALALVDQGDATLNDAIRRENAWKAEIKKLDAKYALP